MSSPAQTGDLVSKSGGCLDSDLIGLDALVHLFDAASLSGFGTAILSLLLPLGIFLGINNVRLGRKGLIEDLEALFSATDENGQRPVVHSFEMLKYRYDADSDLSNNLQAVASYIFPVALFVLLCLIGFGVSFSGTIPDCHGGKLSPLINPTGTLVGSLAYTFFGAYLWSVSHLIRRVANYDLSPISFLQAVLHLLLATFVSAAIWHAHVFERAGANLQVAVAFLIGWFPDLFLGVLIAKFPWLALRRVGSETKQLREEIPLDTILGIDSFIKLRLNEYEIMDVQNLATANPIKIFVETPYGLFEVIDWIAQAQLILAVGSANVVELRKHNIRTIFDLEKGVRNKALNATLLAILRGDARQPATPQGEGDIADPTGPAATAAPFFPRGPIGDGAGDDPRYDRYCINTERALDFEDELATMVAIIRDDLHVRRLRQIWDIVNGRLNERVQPSPA